MLRRQMTHPRPFVFHVSAWAIAVALSSGEAAVQQSAKPGASAKAATESPAPASPMTATAADGLVSLDTTAIHNAYSEGDFDKVLAALEPVLNLKSRTVRADSVFLFKHLGVIYSKNPSTREKGKYCFRKLFDVDDKAQILDMYATDDIYAVFRTVRDEWDLTHPGANRATAGGAAGASGEAALGPKDGGAAGATAVGRPIVVESHVAERKSASNKPSWKPWAAVGGAVAVTAGLTTWYLLSQPGERDKVSVRVDPGPQE